MAAGDINDPLSNIPNIALVDQSAASAAPGAGYARLESVNGVLGLRVGTGAWVPMLSLVAGLLTALDAKTTPVAGDLLLLQDSEDGGAIKKLTIGDLPAGEPGGGGGAALLLNYVANTDLLDGAAWSASVWTDVCANQSFTVVNASAVVAITVRVSGQTIGANSSCQLSTRIVIDSAGSPAYYKLGGQAHNVTTHSFSGGVVYITGLPAGAHTVKLQGYHLAQTATAYLRASSGPDYEFLSIEVVEFAP